MMYEPNLINMGHFCAFELNLSMKAFIDEKSRDWVWKSIFIISIAVVRRPTLGWEACCHNCKSKHLSAGRNRLHSSWLRDWIVFFFFHKAQCHNITMSQQPLSTSMQLIQDTGIHNSYLQLNSNHYDLDCDDNDNTMHCNDIDDLTEYPSIFPCPC